MNRFLTDKRLALGPALALILAMSSPSAQALNYVETTDFPGAAAFPGFSVGTLGPGAHTVAGRLDGSCVVGSCNGGGLGDTQDSFSFTVAPGTLITELTLISSGVSGPPGFRASLQLQSQGGGVFANTATLPNNAGSGNLLLQPMGPGLYSLSVYGQSATQPGAFSFPYLISFNPQLVPEPATALLFALGGLALLAGRRGAAGNRP